MLVKQFIETNIKMVEIGMVQSVIIPATAQSFHQQNGNRYWVWVKDLGKN